LTHFFGVQHDVTDVVEQRLEKDMFNAGVLHDIKSPLMGQARILEYMAKQSTSGELEGVSSLMLQTLKDSMHLVSDTLDLYKLENELVVPNLSTVSAKTFIQSVIDSVKDDARDKRIQLHCLQPEGDHQVTFDTSMVFRALKNLVENAVCYSQPGKDIWILSSANDSAQMIAVVDHGSGLPTQVVKQFEHDSAAPSVLHSAFESPTKHKSSLGLLACGQIMRAHNGKLNLIKSDRFGTEFALTFPMYTLAQRSGNLPVK
jgi:K+-sensing histidine kinase KdpD